MSYRKSIDSSSVVFTQAGAGAAASTVDGKLGETLSVLDFGAVGDGVTDDSTAVQAALDALQDGDTLLFPDGLYIIGTGLTLAKSGVTLKGSNSPGEGQGDFGKGPVLITNAVGTNVLTLIQYAGTNTDLLSYTTIYTSIGNVQSSNITIDGLQFSRIGAPHTGKVIDASLSGITSLTVRNCTFMNMNMCIDCPTSLSGTIGGNALIDNNLFSRCSSGASPVVGIGGRPLWFTNNMFENTLGVSLGLGTNLDGASSAVITGNVFDSRTSGGNSTIDISGNTLVNDNWVIGNNIFFGQFSGAAPGSVSTLTLTNLSHFAITGNIFVNIYVIDIDSTSSNGIISGNYMRNTETSTDSIVCAGDRISILNNQIQSTRGTDLIKLTATASFCTVSGNVLLDSPDAFISIATGIDDLGTNNDTAGLIGPAGASGETGVTGAAGSAGSAGSAGDIGGTGASGETGATGAGGAGAIGATGETGSSLLGITTVGTTGTLATTDGAFIDVTAGDITVTLPAVASAATGKVYHIKDADGSAGAANITIEGNAAEAIDAALNFVLTVNFQSISIVNLGDKWSIF